MLIQGTSRTAARQLWLSIGIALTLALYRLSFALGAEIRLLMRPHVPIAIEQPLSEFLFVWLALLLWMAYRQWRHTMLREHELGRIIDSITPDSLIAVKADGTIDVCSQAVERMFGYRPAEILNQRTELLYVDSKSNGRHSDCHSGFNGCEFIFSEAIGRKKDGTSFPVELSTAELKGCSGTVQLIRDISERKRLEQWRDDLLHMIIHDLKGPLAAIDGYLRMLMRRAGQPIDGEKMGYLKEASALVWDQIDMIDTLLDINRMESGEMPLALEPCDVAELVDGAIKRIASPDRHAIQFDRPDNACRTACDPRLITRVVSNLLDNAVKYSPDGTVIRIALRQRDGELEVSVADEGLGISPRYKDCIFDRFVQAPEHTAPPHSAGLGLTFCKLAVEAHGGHIGVDSEVGKGSVFCFTLPTRKVNGT